MPTIHTVEQGEYLSKIAKRYGFANWHLIYDDPNNSDLRKLRPDPNVLLPGDTIYIPDKSERVQSCSTDRRHVFQLGQVETILRVLLKDDEDRPYANMEYQVQVPEEHASRKGTTDQTGKLEQQIPVSINTVDLILPDVGLAWTLQVGHLDPVHDEQINKPIVTGIQARLQNLGYDCGPVDGILGPRTTAALQEFQKDVLHRMDPTGDLDKDTRDALQKEHGC